MKRQFLAAAITVIFAGMIATGCSGKAPEAPGPGGGHAQPTIQDPVAAADVTEGGSSSEGKPESTQPEGQTGKEPAEGQTVLEEAQTGRDGQGETVPEGGNEGQDGTSGAPSAKKPGTTTTQPETAAQTKAPAQSTQKPGAPEQPETQAQTKAPAQSTPKPAVPAQPETQAQTKAPAQSAPKPTSAPQPETQAQTKAPDKPKEKTMWDAPYDVEAIKAYMVAELKARGYVDVEDFEAMSGLVNSLWGVKLDYEDWRELITIQPFGDHFGAWDSECTATAGPNRYYDNVNHCTVGHQHYSWSSPATGAGEKKNSEGLTSLEFMVNDAINYWCYMYGEGHMFPEEEREYRAFRGFLLYTEKFEDRCAVFYILAGII